MSKVHINLGDRSYDILIEEKLLKKIPEDLLIEEKGNQAVLISNETVYLLYGKSLSLELKEKGFQVFEYIIPEGESYKSWDIAGSILSKMLEDKISRDAFALALGGGVIGDLAGFVASIYQRGIKFYQIPTSLLAQVDSSVGGKVAVNHAAGKNMIGSFYQPQKVYIDTQVLLTLPPRDWKSGLAEVIKYGIIKDKSFFEYIENNVEKIKDKDLKIFEYLIKRSCEIKGEIVEADERESGIRAYLNLGHTIAHGIETITEYEYFRHGEAVAAGISIIAEIAFEKGYLLEKDMKRINNLFKSLDMVYKLPKMPGDMFMDILYLDKKNHKGKMVLIIPEEIGVVEKTEKISAEELKNFLLSKEVLQG
jgi:3-dehydroquinate synthase